MENLTRQLAIEATKQLASDPTIHPAIDPAMQRLSMRLDAMAWAPARPVLGAGLVGVVTAPVQLRTAGELCPSPDQVLVTQSHRPRVFGSKASGAATRTFPSYANAIGVDSAFGTDPSTQGSLRPAPPG